MCLISILFLMQSFKSPRKIAVYFNLSANMRQNYVYVYNRIVINTK